MNKQPPEATTAPDPADSYERAKPEKASPQGTLDAPKPPVHEAPDKNAPEAGGQTRSGPKE